MKVHSSSWNFQKGMATLTVTVVILVIVTLMVLFATKVGILDQRMAGNEARYKEAFATAEAGLDLAIQRFEDQFMNNFSGSASWVGIVNGAVIANGTGLNGSAAGASQPSYGVTITDTGALIGGISVFQFTSTGIGADGTGTATVSRQVTMKKILGGSAPDVPIIVAGSVGTGGDFNIVANPNGGGPGIPVSVWTGTSPAGDVSIGGSSATCHIQYYDGNQAQCSNPSGTSELLSKGSTGTVLTAHNNSFPDILPNDPNFPDDLFQFLFGVAHDDWASVRSMAISHNQMVSGCSGLNSTSGQKFRLWWITGNCEMGSTQVIGSKDDPVILVIDDHELDMGGGGAKIYGIAYLFDNPSDAATPSADFHGSPEIHGAFISEMGGSAMQGSYSIVYDPTLISNLTSDSDSSNFNIAYIPGSWRDFN